MVKRQEVLSALAEGQTYAQAAERLGISPGLAYLVATGVATDSSDALRPEEYARPGMSTESQALSNPPVDMPDRSEHVRRFLRARASADAQMQAAAHGRREQG
jgi:hypothetical protein